MLATFFPHLADAQSFTVKQGSLTVATENFTRTPTRVEGDLRVMASPRLHYVLELDAQGIPVVLHNAAYQPGNDTLLMQSAVLTFKDDSVIAEIDTRGKKVTQRIKSERGAFPFLNVSFALLEPLLAASRAHNSDPAHVPAFAVAGGQTFTYDIKWVRPDSVVVALAGVELQLKVDADNRILHGFIPSQNVTIERGSGPASLVAEKVDYSAPADARFIAVEVVIPNGQVGKLAGTLTKPKATSSRTTKKAPVVITISGSGLQDRDESIPIVPGYKPFRQYAEVFAEKGIATLRFDDRGYGGSTGDVGAATTQDFASDVRSVVAWLRTRGDIDANNIFLLGHSEGGVIAPMVAATDANLRGIVLMAGTAYTGRKVLEYQLRNTKVSVDSIRNANAWMKYFVDYDPVPTARGVKTVPVLIMQGETDQQVTADQAPVLEKAFRAGGNRDVTMHVVPGVNHLFLKDASGDPANYAKLPDSKVSPAIIATMADWIIKHAK